MHRTDGFVGRREEESTTKGLLLGETLPEIMASVLSVFKLCV
jgi:hypothetical protein